MRSIEHLVEPERLLLLWQAVNPATNKAEGDRFVVGEVRQEDGSVYLHYYDNEDTRKAHDQYGFNGLTAYPYEANKTYNGTVSDVLSKRLAPTTRSDYADYLRSYRLPVDKADQLSLMQLLAYTGGTLAGDGFSFSYTFDNTQPPFDFTFEIAGFRHNEGMEINPITQLQDEEVTLVPEPENEHDEDAIAVYWNDTKLGFVFKGMATVVAQCILDNHAMTAYVTRINGTTDRPRIMVLAQVR